MKMVHPRSVHRTDEFNENGAFTRSVHRTDEISGY